MIIRDNSIEYDTDYIDAAIINNNRTSVERDILNAFNRLAYYYYARIRDCVNSRKCKNMKIDMVSAKLQEDKHITFTIRKTNLNKKQIEYILKHVEKVFPSLVK